LIPFICLSQSIKPEIRYESKVPFILKDTIFLFNTKQIRDLAVLKNENLFNKKNAEYLLLRLEKKDSIISKLKESIKVNKEIISKYKEVIKEKDDIIENYHEIITVQNSEISNMNKSLQNKDKIINEKLLLIEDKDKKIKTRNNRIIILGTTNVLTLLLLGLIIF
jgi:hypothetical protein